MRRGECQYNKCENTKKAQPGLRFFHFPRNLERKMAWVLHCNRDELLSALTFDKKRLEEHSVCENHFSVDCFMRPGYKDKLVWDAVPTLDEPELNELNDALDELHSGSPQTIAELLPPNLLANTRNELRARSPPVVVIEPSPAASLPLILLEDSLASSPREDVSEESLPFNTHEEFVRTDIVPIKYSSRQEQHIQLRGTKPTTPRYEDVSQLVSRFTSIAKVELKCRMCMLESGKKPMIPLFKNQPVLKVPLATKIFDITGLEPEEGDGLPDQICQPCNKNMVNCYDFRALCIRSDEKYRKQIEKQMAKKRKPTNIAASGAKPRKRQYRPEVVINMEAYKKPRLVKTTETYNKPHQVIVTENPIDVKLEIEEHNIFDTGSHFMSRPTTMYDGQDLEQMSQEAGGHSMDEMVPPPFFTVKVEPEEEESMWNPEVSLNYKPHDDHNTSQLPDTECKIEFIGGGTVDTALVDPLSIPTPEVTVAAPPMTGPQIPTLTIRNQPSTMKRAKYLLAVKPVSASMSTPPSYVLAISSDPPADSTPVSTFPVNIPAMPNLSVITNVPVPLSTRPDSVAQSILPRNNDVDPLGNDDSGAKESNGDPSGV